MTWAWENRDYLISLTFDHLWLSIVPIVAGFLIATPIGWFANRNKAVGTVIVSSASLVYTIPSLPLLVLMPGLIGTGFLSPINVVITLTLYAVAIMVRTATDAFSSVSDAVIDSSTATGFSAFQRAFTVELPLAGPVLLAGLRVVSVSTVSLVSIGALVGVRNLGSLFTNGFQRNFTLQIIIGIILTVALALLLDALLVYLGKLAMPWYVPTKIGADA